MRIYGYAPLAGLLAGAVLAAVAAGCGGSSSASSVSSSNAASTSPTATTATTPSNPPSNPPRVPLSTPQGAVRSYIEGVEAVNGGAICNAMDATLERKIIKEIVAARPSEAHSPCAKALAGLVAATTTASERSGKLPTFRVTTTGNTAVVKYRGTHTHHQHTFTLVKQGPGWLIDKVNEKG